MIDEMEALAISQLRQVPQLAPYATKDNVRIGVYVVLALPLLLLLLPFFLFSVSNVGAALEQMTSEGCASVMWGLHQNR